MLSLRMRALCIVLAPLLSFGGAASAGTSGNKVRLPKVQELVDQRASSEDEHCFATVVPLAVAGPYAVVVSTLLCQPKNEDDGDKRQRYVSRKRLLTIVDWKRMRLVGREIESRPTARCLDFAEVNGRPALLVADGQDLVLRLVDDESTEEYRWACPASECPSTLGAQIMGDSGFPFGPVRVAAVGRGEFLVSVFDLYPAQKEQEKKGRVHKVDEFVPAAAWKQEFRRATDIEEEVERVFLDQNVLLKYASYLPLLDKEIGEMVLETADRYVDNSVRSMSLHYTPEHGFLFATQQPFTLTRVDPESGKFTVHRLAEFGAHIRPLSLSSNFSLLAAFPESSRAVRLLVEGALCESMRQYTASRGTGTCHGDESEFDSGEKRCCYALTALVRYDLEGEVSEWQVWEGRDKRQVNRLVVEATRTGATCLAVYPEEDPGVLVKGRCGSD